MPLAGIDLAPLGLRPSAADVAAYQAAVRRGDHGTKAKELARLPGGCLAGVMVGGLLGLVFGGMTVAALVDGRDEDVEIGLVFLAGTALIGLVIGLLVAIQDRRGRRTSVRLQAFAEANGFEHQPWSRPSKLPMIPTGDRRAGVVADRMRWMAHDRTPAELAEYHRRTGRYGVHFRYLAVNVGGTMPRLAFRSGRRGSSVRPRLEGQEAFPGERHSLRAAAALPDGATALFDERVVELLTEPDRAWDAEYRDGWFIAYPPLKVDHDDAFWRHVLELAEAAAAASSTRRSLM